MEDDDNLSEDTFGSVISLESLEDSSPVREKPKRGKKKTRPEQSPYLSRQFSGNAHARSLGKSTGHEAWSAAIRNGYSGLSSESSPSTKWAQSRGTAKRSKVPNYGKNGPKSQSGPFSRDEHILASGKPAYKSPEDYYDEVMELRQVIKELKDDNSVLKTKLQRITQENVLKDRQIKDFLNPNKQPDEIRRTLTDRKADSSAVVSSLKQKLHLMERNVKDKENELRKLKSDLKSTNIEELRIQIETYYQETRRLQSVLSSVYSQAPGTRTVPSARSFSSRTSNRTNSPGPGDLTGLDQERLEKMLDDNRRLESENKSLKKDLLIAVERPNKGGKTLTKKNVDYADMNRIQMLRKIGELEQLLEDAEAQAKNNARKDNVENERTNVEKERDKEERDELRKQRLTLENLKQDRTHYREQAEKLRVELQTAHEEIELLREDVKKANQRKLSKDKSTPPRPLPRQRNRTGAMKKGISFQEVDQKDSHREKDEERAARTLQRHWRQYNKQKATNEDKDFLSDVVQIQSILRGHAMRKQSIERLQEAPDNESDQNDLEWEDAVTRIQSALRAHQSRRKYYPSAKRKTSEESHRLISASDHRDAPNDEDRERRNRTTSTQPLLNKSSQEDSPERKSSVSTNRSELVEEIDDDDDDDVVIGGSRHTLGREHPTIRTHGEPTSNTDGTGRTALRGPKVVSEDSEDDIQMTTRHRKPTAANRSTDNRNRFSFAKSDSAKKKNLPEQISTFFGREKRITADQKEEKIGINKESSLDNLFSPSRPMKHPFDHRAGSDEDSEDYVVTSSKKTNGIVENKENKSVFSWGDSKSKKSKDDALFPRKRTSSDKKGSSKPSNVWSSRPSELLEDDDDDDDDVIVTPKVTRRNQTKTASLLDELF